MCHVTARDTRSQRESLRMETRIQRIPDVAEYHTHQRTMYTYLQG